MSNDGLSYAFKVHKVRPNDRSEIVIRIYDQAKSVQVFARQTVFEAS